jgi:hypothetical protein
VSGSKEENLVAEINMEACNAHLAEDLEIQMNLIKGALQAVQEGELKRAKLFLNSASWGCQRNVEFLSDMIEARAA